MLESLLVLGQIPGTKIQLTFTELVLAIYLPMLAAVWFKRKRFANMDRRYFQLMRLRRRVENELHYIGVRPVKSTRRTVVTLPVRTFQRPILLPARPARRAF
jgi:hypothetical protein